jgi:hypothetical protein
MQEKILTSKNIVATKHSDHYIIDTLVASNIGPIHAYSLNLLTRQAITFRQSNDSQHVNVRLNCPLSWFLDNPQMCKIQEKLQEEGKELRLICNDKKFPFEKKQLELVDISSKRMAKHLPKSTRIYLETEEEFIKRMYSLGDLIANIMMESARNKEIIIFAIQELTTDKLGYDSFMAGVHSNNRENISCARDVKAITPYVPALLYDNDQLEYLNEEISFNWDKNFNDFEKDLVSIIRGNSNSTFIGQLFVGYFRSLSCDTIISAVIYHGDFSMINQESHETLPLMTKIANLCQDYSMVIAGDFNRKIDHQDDMQLLGAINDTKNIYTAFHSTEPGLQLHDTLDAIFAPKNYPHLFERKSMDKF